MQLHPVQKQLLVLLEKHSEEPLSIRELQDEVGASSPSVIQHHIKQLEKKGFLRRNPSNPQDYQVLDTPDSDIVYLNLYGMAQCGPNGRLLDGTPSQQVPVYSPMLGFPAAEAFLVKVRGKSMEPDVHEGDMVIVRKTSNVNNNDMAVCVNDGNVLIKRVQTSLSNKRRKQYILTSSNPAFKPIIASEDDFRVEGLVKGILKYTV